MTKDASKSVMAVMLIILIGAMILFMIWVGLYTKDTIDGSNISDVDSSGAVQNTIPVTVKTPDIYTHSECVQINFETWRCK